MYWFSINKILTEQEFNFLNEINKLFRKEICLLPKRVRRFLYETTPCPTPVTVERLLFCGQAGRARLAGTPSAVFNPAPIPTVQLVAVPGLPFSSPCFSCWRGASSRSNRYVSLLGFLLIWDIPHFADMRSYLISATAFLSRPSP